VVARLDLRPAVGRRRTGPRQPVGATAPMLLPTVIAHPLY